VRIRVIPNVAGTRPDDGQVMDGSTPATTSAPHPDEIALGQGAHTAAGLQSYERLAQAGAIWCLVFAVTHFYWAGGGRLGTNNVAAISNRPLFLAYDLAAGFVFLAAAAVATVLTRRLIDARLRSRLLTATIWGAVVALVRGVGGITQDVVTASMGHGVGIGVSYDIWFAVAGVVFLVAGLGLRRRQSDPPAFVCTAMPMADARKA
jgi:Protein of unknown function (DUF3995)